MAKKLFTITVQVNGETLAGKGETLLEALQSMPKPNKISTKALINITYGDKTVDKVFMPIRARRFFMPSVQDWKSLAVSLSNSPEEENFTNANTPSQIV